MDTKPLTPTQRAVLHLLQQHGSAAFQGQQGRQQGDRALRSWEGRYGLVIEAYQGPEYFLKNRGLIERFESNAPGHWYRLTEDGARRASSIQSTRPK